MSLTVCDVTECTCACVNDNVLCMSEWIVRKLIAVGAVLQEEWTVFIGFFGATPDVLCTLGSLRDHSGTMRWIESGLVMGKAMSYPLYYLAFWFQHRQSYEKN